MPQRCLRAIEMAWSQTAAKASRTSSDDESFGMSSFTRACSSKVLSATEDGSLEFAAAAMPFQLGLRSMPRQRSLIGTTGRRRCGWCGRSAGSKVTLTCVSLIEKLTLMRSGSALFAHISATCRMKMLRLPFMRARWRTAVRVTVLPERPLLSLRPILTTTVVSSSRWTFWFPPPSAGRRS